MCLLPDGMVVVSGGMLSDNKKCDVVQVFDYENKKLVSEARLHAGRSSHRTVVHDGMIIMVGGFTNNN